MTIAAPSDLIQEAIDRLTKAVAEIPARSLGDPGTPDTRKSKGAGMLTAIESDRSNRRTSIIVGGLFLISYAGVFIGSSITGGVVDADYLVNAFPDRFQLTLGTLVELVNDLAVIGIAVLLYPFLKKASEGVALFYVGLRILEAAFFMVAKVATLAFVDISENFLAAGTAEAATYERLGELALAMPTPRTSSRRSPSSLAACPLLPAAAFEAGSPIHLALGLRCHRIVDRRQRLRRA